MKNYILICFLWLVSFTVNSQTFSISKTGTIPDNNCTVTNDFPFTTVSGIGILDDKKIFDQVAIDITISYVADLDISLVAPNGTTVIRLVWGRGGAGNDFINTVFREDAPQSITEGSAPFTGFFVPEGDLSQLNGLNADGTWNLRICDMGPGSSGNLNNASLTFVNKTNTCIKPSQVYSSLITPKSARLTWNSSAGSFFQYVLDNSPVNPTNGLPAPEELSSVNYNILIPEKNYFFHIRKVCNASSGSYSNWVVTKFTTPPVNDRCEDATSINSLPFMIQQYALGDTNNAGFVKACDPGSPISLMNDGVWYKFKVATKGNAQVIVSNNLGWNPKIAVYTGNCAALTCLGSVDFGQLGEGETLNLNDLLPMDYYLNIADGSGTVDNLEGSFQVDVTGDITVLGSDSFDKTSFLYYPNPVKNKLNLSYNRSITSVSLYNLLGQKVEANPIGTNFSQIDMSTLSTGSYILKIMSENQVQNIKVIKE